MVRYNFFLPIRGVPPIERVLTLGGQALQVRGREVIPKKDFDPIAAFRGAYDGVAIPIPAPPLLAPWKRGNAPGSSIGAQEMPSPLQITIWPTFLQVIFQAEIGHTELIMALDRLTTSEWGEGIPTSPGFRRTLAYDSSESITPEHLPRYDISGNVRDFGCNDEAEFTQTVPVDTLGPAVRVSAEGGRSWSLLLSSKVFTPQDPLEARRYAKHVNDCMIATGNLWVLRGRKPVGATAATHHVQDVANNLSAAVEAVAYAVFGEAASRKAVQRVKDNPLYEAFEGSEATFVRVLAMCLEPRFNGVLRSNRAAVERLAAAWHLTRNPETHEPGPLLAAEVDLASRRRLFGADRARETSVAAMQLVLDLVERAGLFPTAALSA